MAETSHFERTYVVPLRKEWMKVPSYKRARKGVVALKEFIAQHMKVPNRDLDKVKIDIYLNNEMWYRGSSNSPSHIKVKAKKQGDLVHVTLADIPDVVKFAQQKNARFHKKADKKTQATEEKIEEKTEEEKKDESEKGKSVAIANEKFAEQQNKAQKHTSKAKTPEVHRMALKK
jgi:ribosomal protein L31E